MAVSLGDELVVALAVQPAAIPGRPLEQPGFSLTELAKLTGRSAKAVEEALYDLHRAGLVTVKVEVRRAVVCLIAAELTAPAGRALAEKRLAAVREAWQERTDAARRN
jgi:hypothetical protein